MFEYQLKLPLYQYTHCANCRIDRLVGMGICGTKTNAALGPWSIVEHDFQH